MNSLTLYGQFCFLRKGVKNITYFRKMEKNTLLQGRLKDAFCSDKHTWVTILGLSCPKLLPCSLLRVAIHKWITYNTVRYIQVRGMTKHRSTAAARQNNSRFINSPAFLCNQRGAIIWIHSIKTLHTHTHIHLHYISWVPYGSVGATAQGQINISPPLPTHCQWPER